MAKPEGPGGDLISAVLTSVRRYDAVDNHGRLVQAEILEFLARAPEPFDPAFGHTHITASAMVVGRRGLLLHRHKRLGIWLQPGGHIDRGETPWAAAKREAAEETGLEVEIVTPADSIPAVFNLDIHNSALGHVHLDLCYLAAPLQDRAPAPPLGESQEVAWVSADEAVRIGDTRLAAMAAQVQIVKLDQDRSEPR
jgi:8-oxo-dGTP pyrophosphatase MutT (NUDIX family)